MDWQPKWRLGAMACGHIGALGAFVRRTRCRPYRGASWPRGLMRPGPRQDVDDPVCNQGALVP